MANHASHASLFALLGVVKGARCTIQVPYLDSSGTPTDPTTPDTEIAKDGGAFADTAEEVTTITGGNGSGFLTLTGDETDCSMLSLAAKAASGPKPTLLNTTTFVPVPVVTGTAQAGAAGTVTLPSSASAIDDYYNGCAVMTTGGTGGGGGSGKLNNQVRVITDYNGSTKVATIEPNWETTPDNTTTVLVFLTPLAINALKWGGQDITSGLPLTPTVAGRPLDVTAGGAAGIDLANVENQGATLNLTATTIKSASDIEADTQDIQTRLPGALTADGNMKADALRISGSATAADTVETNIANLDDAISAVPTATENADELLKRDWTAVSGEAARSVLNALRVLRNKFEIITGICHVKKEDDATDAFTIALTTDAGADPIVAGDPS